MPKVASKKTPAKSKGISVDFTGVESRVLLPEGDYQLEVSELTQEESESGNPYLKWVFLTVDEDPKLNSKKVYHNTSLLPQALWNLRNLLETLGIEVPDAAIEIDPEELIGLSFMGTLVHEDYNGKAQVRLTEYMPLSEEEEEEPVKVDKKGGKSSVKEQVKYSVEEIENFSREELVEIIQTEKLEVDPASAKTVRKLQTLVLAELEEREQIG